jgi:hypothetical protein
VQIFGALGFHLSKNRFFPKYRNSYLLIGPRHIKTTYGDLGNYPAQFLPWQNHIE